MQFVSRSFGSVFNGVQQEIERFQSASGGERVREVDGRLIAQTIVAQVKMPQKKKFHKQKFHLQKFGYFRVELLSRTLQIVWTSKISFS